MDENNAIKTKMREAEVVLAQTSNAEAAFAAGALGYEEYIDAKAKRIACFRMMDLLNAGTEVSDDEFAEMIEAARVDAEAPSNEEIMRADIDYLLMVGGDL